MSDWCLVCMLQIRRWAPISHTQVSRLHASQLCIGCTSYGIAIISLQHLNCAGCFFVPLMWCAQSCGVAIVSFHAPFLLWSALLCAQPESISRISDGGCRCAADVGIGDLGRKNTTYAVRGCCSLILPIDCHHHLQCSGCSASACTVARDVASTSHDMEAGRHDLSKHSACGRTVPLSPLLDAVTLHAWMRNTSYIADCSATAAENCMSDIQPKCALQSIQQDS